MSDGRGVGVDSGVFVSKGVRVGSSVAVGAGVSVAADGVGENDRATWVNSATTVIAASVKMASGAVVGVAGSDGNWQLASIPAAINRIIDNTIIFLGFIFPPMTRIDVSWLFASVMP